MLRLSKLVRIVAIVLITSQIPCAIYVSLFKIIKTEELKSGSFDPHPAFSLSFD
jgi:hypothetical protein